MFIKEVKVLKRNLNYTVSTKPSSQKNSPSPTTSENGINNDASSSSSGEDHNTPNHPKLEEEEKNVARDNFNEKQGIEANKEEQDKVDKEGTETNEEQDELEKEDTDADKVQDEDERDKEEEDEEENGGKLTMEDLNQYQVNPEGQEELVTPATISTEINEQKTPDDTTKQELASEVIPRNEIHQSTTTSSLINSQYTLSSSMSSLQELIGNGVPSSTNMKSITESSTSELENVDTVLPSTQYTTSELHSLPFPSSTTSQKSEDNTPASSIKLTSRYTVLDGTTLPVDDNNDIMFDMDSSSTPDIANIQKNDSEPQVQAVNSIYPYSTTSSLQSDKESIASSVHNEPQKFTKEKDGEGVDDSKSETIQKNGPQPSAQNNVDSVNELKRDDSAQRDESFNGKGHSSFDNILGGAKNFVSSFFGSQGSEGVPRTSENEFSQSSLGEDANDTHLNIKEKIEHNTHPDEMKSNSESVDTSSKDEHHESNLDANVKATLDKLETNDNQEVPIKDKEQIQKGLNTEIKNSESTLSNLTQKTYQSSNEAKSNYEQHTEQKITNDASSGSAGNNNKKQYAFNEQEKNGEEDKRNSQTSYDVLLNGNPKSNQEPEKTLTNQNRASLKQESIKSVTDELSISRQSVSDIQSQNLNKKTESSDLQALHSSQTEEPLFTSQNYKYSEANHGHLTSDSGSEKYVISTKPLSSESSECISGSEIQSSLNQNNPQSHNTDSVNFDTSVLSKNTDSISDNSKYSSQTEEPLFTSQNYKYSEANHGHISDSGSEKYNIISTKPLSSESSVPISGSEIQSSLNKNNPQNHNIDSINFDTSVLSENTDFTSDNPKYLKNTRLYDKLEDDDKIVNDRLKDETQLNENGNDKLYNDHIPSTSEYEIYTDNGYMNEKSTIQKDSENIPSDKVAESKNDSPYDLVTDYISLLRAYLQAIIDILPEPLHSAVIDLEKQGVSPRVTVFLTIASGSSVILIVSICFLKKTAKETSLLLKLSTIEQKLFTTTTERNVQMEELEGTKQKLLSLEQSSSEQQDQLKPLQEELQKIMNENSQMHIAIEKKQQQLEDMKHSSKELHQISQRVDEENVMLHKKIEESRNTIKDLEEQLENSKLKLSEVEEHNDTLIKNEEESKSCIAQLEHTCSQLLQEAEVWNDRVAELTSQIENDKKNYECLEEASKNKDIEIMGLQETLKEAEVIQELKEEHDPEEVEKRIQQLLEVSVVRQELQLCQAEVSLLKEKLESEKEKVQNIEIELLDTTSEVEKLKTRYNLALQDKTEAQTKLGVLSNYFKEKELQLQKELGVQEAMRLQKEGDATSASRRIALIQEENSSYKYQLASVKQELEETERNLRNQIAAQEKRAHENWLAARAAERKLEEAKQEMTQLRQRLTLLEREQEAWTKSQQDGIVRSLGKRFPGPNGEVPFPPGQILPQEMAAGEAVDPNAPLPPDMIDSSKTGRSLPPKMLPPNRPIPPPPLDHHMPHIPPFLPHMDVRLPPPPFGLEPWRLPPPGMLLNSGPPSYHSFDRRMTPPDYERGRMSTPPRVHQPSPPYERDLDRHSASPREQQSRDSRSSSPPNPLPRFHDLPPPRRFGYSFPPPPPPPLGGGRLPLYPPRRREPFPPGPPEYRPDSRGGDIPPPRRSQPSTPPTDVRTNNTTMDV